MKLVSCIIPVNRDDGFLDEAVQSVLSQSYSEFEIIIVANNCSDELWEKIQAYHHPAISSYRLALGQVSFARNFAIEKSKGDFIAILDADDVCLRDRFQRQVAFMEANPSYDIVGSGFEAINASGETIHYQSNIYQSHDAIVKALPITCPLTHSTVMYRRSTILAIGGYAYGILCEDYDLWLRARRLDYRFYNLPDKLVQFRLHGEQVTHGAKRKQMLRYGITLKVREFMLSHEFRFLIGIFVFTQTGQWMLRLLNRLKQISNR